MGRQKRGGRGGRKEERRGVSSHHPSFLHYLFKGYVLGPRGGGGGGRSGEEEEKNEKETETAGERKRKREGGKGVGQGWVYPTTPLLPSPLPPNDREAVSAL